MSLAADSSGVGPGESVERRSMGFVLTYVRPRRIFALLAFFLAAAFFLNLPTNPSPQPSSSYLRNGASRVLTTIGGDRNLKTSDTRSFWPQFYATLTGAAPRCGLPRPPVVASTPRFYPWGAPTERQDLIKLHEDDEKELRDAHAWFVAQIQSPSFPKPYFVPGSSGIVTSAGGKYLPNCLVSLRMLRRTGSTLPVDVFLATPDEAEGDICETIMPALGARCRILFDMLNLAEGGLPRRFSVTHFQIKAFAMLLSQFDNVFWLDADNLPLVDPRSFLESEPFRSNGIVTWPDYWAETASPAYFRIAGIPAITSGSRGASESAQLLVSKSTHLQTLELATYYNLYGPSHYYQLINQGAYGSGDKDTFLFAAAALGAPFYEVKTPLQTLGYHDETNDWEPMSILQANPTVDQKRYGSGKNHTGFDYVFPDEQFTLERVRSRVPAGFLHSEQNKPNAVVKLGWWRGQTPRRSYQPGEEMIEAFGYDIEKTIWDELVWTACGKELNGHVFKGWVDDWEDSMKERKRKIEEGKGKWGSKEVAKADLKLEKNFELIDVCASMRVLYRRIFTDGGAATDAPFTPVLKELHHR